MFDSDKDGALSREEFLNQFERAKKIVLKKRERQ